MFGANNHNSLNAGKFHSKIHDYWMRLRSWWRWIVLNDGEQMWKTVLNLSFCICLVFVISKFLELWMILRLEQSVYTSCSFTKKYKLQLYYFVPQTKRVKKKFSFFTQFFFFFLYVFLLGPYLTTKNELLLSFASHFFFKMKSNIIESKRLFY